jgi:iron(III) transport system substrate-binding protein
MSQAQVLVLFTAILLYPFLDIRYAAIAAEAKDGWRAEWTKILEGAKREGKVVIHGAAGEDLLYDEFRKKYPDIRIVYIAGGGNERVDRIMSERRAKQYLADLYIGGKEPLYSVLYKGRMLDPVRSILLMPEILDQSKWWRGGHFYLDEENQYIFAFNGIVTHYFHHNTSIIDPAKFNSYWDLLADHWKGKLLLWDPTQPGTEGVLRFLYYNQKLGPPFLKRLLLEMDVTLTRDRRQFVDWLATGKFPIAGFQSTSRIGLERAKEQGLPVNWFDARRFREGAPLSTGSGNIALIKDAPHPNAAKVFINWLLSREGQMAYQSVRRFTGGTRDSLREDISKEEVPPYTRRLKGGDYWIETDPLQADVAPVWKFIKEMQKGRP